VSIQSMKEAQDAFFKVTGRPMSFTEYIAYQENPAEQEVIKQRAAAIPVTEPEVTTTSVDTTTDSQQPSTDVSGTGMLAETREQSQARESVTDDTTSYEQRVNNLKIELTNQMDMLKLNDFAYVNPDDLDYIIDEQAKEFAKAGVDSILDIGKRTEKVTDPNTGNTKYRYTEGMVGFGGTGERTIEVDPSLVREVSLQGAHGSTETMYMATLPSEMPVLYNKKTNERIDVFQGGGTLYGGGDEATIFGDLYSGVEGGAALNIEFMEDGTPLFYPLYKDTSDQAMINAAVLVGSLAIGAGGGFGEIGKFVGAGEATTAGAKAVGAAIVGGGGGFITSGGDFKSAAIGALLAGATTYGIQSGFVGEKLVELGVPESFLNGDNPLGFKIPIGDPALSAIDAGGALQQPGDVSLDTAEGLDYSLTEGLDYSLPTDVSLAQQDFTPQTYGESSLGVGAPSNLFDQAGMGGVDALISGGTGLSDLTGFSDALPNITDAASAATAVDDIIKAAGAGVVTKEAVEKVVEEADKFIDLKEVFGEDVGGFLEGAVGTGIDFAKLEEIRKRLEGRGEDIAGEFADLFKPYTVRSGLGVSEITPEGATATADVAYQPLRESYLESARQLAGQIPGTREEAAQSLFADISRLSEPQRAREQERLLGTLAQRGLLGYGQTMPTVGGERRVSPLAESLFAAQEAGRAKESLAATQFGTTEADRLAQLSGRLTGAAQSIDKLPADQLARAQNIAYTLGQVPAREGLRTKSQFEQLGAQAEIAGLTELGDFGKGLFGLETDPGNVPIGGDKKYSADEVRKILEAVGITV